LARAISFGLAPNTLDQNTQRRVNDLDAGLFQAFNQRNSEAMRRYYATDVEFLHDHVRRTLNHDTVVTTFRKKIDGDYIERHQVVQREPIEESIRLFPIPGYGVLEVGNHRLIISNRESKRVTATTVGTFVHVIKTGEHEDQIKMALSCDHITKILNQ
jgi:hypothetical protein